jgi:hypothetical protein
MRRDSLEAEQDTGVVDSVSPSASLATQGRLE